MIQVLAATFFLLVLPSSCYGWGVVFRRVTRLSRGTTATTIALGVATVIFFGGWLNLFELAFAPTVVAVLVGGIGALFFAREQVRETLALEWQKIGVGAVLLSVLFVALLVLTQLPPGEYNPGDDLQKYFTWPARMLATGTMVFSSTSAIGAESLGGQSFLHGITLALLPANYLVGLDGIFGVFLCLLLALSLSRDPIAQTLSVFAIVVIHPQSVNISTLYLGAALIMASLKITDETSEPSPAYGILYAALIACKPTFVIFIALHFVTCAIARPDFWRSARGMLQTGVWTVGFVSPWVLLHLRHWLDGIGSEAPAVVGPYQDTNIHIFGLEPLFYGGSLFAYTTIVFGVSLMALFVVWITRKRTISVHGRLLPSVAILTVGYLVVFYIFGPLLTGQALIIRYYTPVVIGMIAVLVSLILSHLNEQKSWQTAAAIALAFTLALFAPTFATRALQLVTQRNQLSYPAATSGYFRAYNEKVLLGLTGERLARAQDLIPPGEPFLAWVDTAFQLNFARNPIHDVEAAGTANPWAVFPKVRYVLWEKENTVATERLYLLVNSKEYRSIFDQGYHERQIAARWIDFYRYVDRLTREGRLIGQQGTLFVYELAPELEAPLKF